MTLGPLEYIVIGFEGNSFDGSIAREIEKVVANRTIRLVDVVFIARDADGAALVIELNNTDDPRFASFAPLLAEVKGLFTPEDLEQIADSLPLDTSGLVLLFEHRWAEDLKDAIVAAGGFLVKRVVIPPEVLEEVSAELEAPSRPRPPRPPDRRCSQRSENEAMMRRRGRPLVRMAATTAVVAGTAGAVSHHQQQKYANQAAEQQATGETQQLEAQVAAQQAQLDAMAAQPAAPAAPPAAPPAAGIDYEQLKQLGDLHTAGVLSDEEFAAAKAKVLAGG